MSCLTKVSRPFCLFKTCAARVNSGIVSFSVVSQCVSCNSMAVTFYGVCKLFNDGHFGIGETLDV